MILRYQDKSPQVASDVFLAEGCKIIGDVVIGEQSSVWFNTVIRGDVNYVRIGKRTNIQDLTMVHVATGTYPTLIGDDVTIGHNAIIHACTIGDRCLIGMGAIVMDGAVIEEDCLIGAGAVVTPRTHVPRGTVMLGSPAKPARAVKPEELAWFKKSAEQYCEVARNYLKIPAKN